MTDIYVSAPLRRPEPFDSPDCHLPSCPEPDWRYVETVAHDDEYVEDKFICFNCDSIMSIGRS